MTNNMCLSKPKRVEKTHISFFFFLGKKIIQQVDWGNKWSHSNKEKNKSLQMEMGLTTKLWSASVLQVLKYL